MFLAIKKEANLSQNSLAYYSEECKCNLNMEILTL